MTTEQTAQQLELAAQIIRTGHPWEWQASDNEWVKPTIRTELHHVISDGLAIRLALATPPDGRPLHNPDNLTAEQVGAGHRLFCEAENDGRHSHRAEMWYDERWIPASDASGYIATYRLPLSVPWPEPQPDPYAELKKAHADGKVIQGCIRGHWIDCPHPTWKYPVDSYRKKPDEKKTVPLGPEDIPPGSVLLSSTAKCNGMRWTSATCSKNEGIEINGRSCIPWVELMSHWQINRSIPLTGKWNPDAWEPCHKEIDA